MAEQAAALFNRARSPKTAEVIASSIRQRIVSRELQPGDRLPAEPDLMEQFGVSRPTLREGIRILENEALVTIRRGAHGGARVREPDPMVAGRYMGLMMQREGTSVREVAEALNAIEKGAIDQLARASGRSDIRGFLEALAALEACLDTSDLPECVWNLRASVVQASGNRAMTIQWRVLKALLDSDASRATPSTVSASSSSADVLSSATVVATLIQERSGTAAQQAWDALLRNLPSELPGADHQVLNVAF
jgi:DNA-binding FadR family transcriptional regulator